MSRIYDGIMGSVVGDALGVPVEFKERDTFKVADMIGYGTYNQPPGTWSDDSSMTLATVESVGRLGHIDPADIMENFAKWAVNADFTPYNDVFDMGGATCRAIQRYMKGTDILKCGGCSRMDNGNGALMRILPLAFIEHTEQDVKQVGGLTHAHEISQNACCLYIHLACSILNDSPVKNAISSLAYLPAAAHSKEFQRIARIGELKRNEIKSSGYVVDTLEAALWCLWMTETYRDCVLMAVNLGEDTDTVAAVAGGLAGIVYGCGGEKGIPSEWISQIARKDWIRELCDKYEVMVLQK